MKFNSLTLRLAALGCGALLAASAHANLVTNGDFEAGTLSGWTVTPSGTTSLNAINNGLEHSGAWYARFGSLGPNDPNPAPADSMSQTLTTVAGASYTVSYWLLNSAGPANEFQFNWDGGLAEQDLVDSPSFPYTQFTSVLVASGASTTISFTAFQNPGFYRLDDVSVEFLSGPAPAGTDVPEPASLALVGLAGALAFASRRRKAA